MGFLIRTVFWLSLVLLIIPIDSGDEPAVSPIAAVLAAREVVGDVAGLCDRKPDVCETGKSAFHTISARAREGARMAYVWIEGDETDDSIATGSIASAD